MYKGYFTFIMSKAIILWLTGLSGSGKTTIVNHVVQKLTEQNKSIKILDGDVVRSTFHTHLGFSPDDITENNRLIAELCIENINNYDYIFVPIISPFSSGREAARRRIGDGFYEVYIKASLETVIQRDVKGLYKKALNNEIENFIGVDAKVPYEIPQKPDLCLDTENNSIEACVEEMINFVKAVSMKG